MNNIFKLEKILNHQNELHFNVPYGPDDVSNPGWAAHYAESAYIEAKTEAESWEKKYNELAHKFDNFFDIPNQNELGEKFPWVGYIDMDGKVYACKQCEHEVIIRQIVLKEYLNEYLKVPASFYDHKPQGTFQEEYFAMKHLGFAKVSAFENTPTKRILFFYNNLTWKQSAQIYPT